MFISYFFQVVEYLQLFYPICNKNVYDTIFVLWIDSPIQFTTNTAMHFENHDRSNSDRPNRISNDMTFFHVMWKCVLR